VLCVAVFKLATGKIVLLSGIPSLPPPGPFNRLLAVPGWTFLPGAATGEPAPAGAEVCGLWVFIWPLTLPLVLVDKAIALIVKHRQTIC